MASLRAGDVVEGYEVLASRAIGGMSEVHRMRHRGNGRVAALKVLQEQWSTDGELVARFRNEARALDALRHPRVVELLAAGDLADGRPFMILEWLPRTLGQVLTEGAALSPPVALQIAAQLAEALTSLHARRLVHRDLKPDNVLFAEQDLARARVKLADLGLAKQLHALKADAAAEELLGLVPVSTGGSATLGTWEYMSPEQWAKSKTVGPATDVYALGVLLFQMLAGQLPFAAEHPQHLMFLHVMEPPPLHLLPAQVASEVRALLEQMLDKKSVRRPDMRDVATRLAALHT